MSSKSIGNNILWLTNTKVNVIEFAEWTESNQSQQSVVILAGNLFTFGARAPPPKKNGGRRSSLLLPQDAENFGYARCVLNGSSLFLCLYVCVF